MLSTFISKGLQVSGEARAVVQDNRLALFHAGRGLMFKSNSSGAHIWEALARRVPADRVASDLAERYGIPAEQAALDVASFLRQLQTAGFVNTGD